MTSDFAAAADMAGKIGVVTGASRGIGRTTTEVLVRGGATVVVVARTGSDLDALKDELADARGAVAPLITDIGSRDAFEDLGARVAALVGDRLDFLVNNAGVLPAGPIESYSAGDWDEALGINVRAVGMTSAALLPALRRSRSASIVNVSSIHALIGMPGRSVYAAGKGGVAALSKQLAIELAADGVRVNAVLPGAIRTSMNEAIFASDEFRARVESAIPLRRIGDPIDVARAIYFLCSEASSYVTGHALVVDGGHTSA
ncbi:SDR family NAD(P)-dependent oxidoreductase [Amycolatopsis pithecellobii]|uniref:SDR family oxidoreductase n=1 Tax=Amycolatopsis pithecellobii TaxID=664692 RepID=A0A6N7YM35_9PSEU|nr:SDR family NAD(P)-dependent oxidoreductase [Amycolatopsis pithecellobii]MTD54015.1 SDR family oxidoreductase [Amycolatopsis pithecellobii]